MTKDDVAADFLPFPTTRRRIPTWVFDIAAGLFVVVSALAPKPDGSYLTPANLVPTMIGLVALALLIPWRRRFPLTALVLCVAVASLSPLWTTSTFGYLSAAAITMYRVAVVTDRRFTAVAAALSVVALVGSTLVTGEIGSDYSHLLPPISIIAVAAALGDASRNRRAYIDAITERARRAEETRELEAERRVTEERLRIARELHDAAAHQIAAISLHAGVASNALRTRPDDAERALEVVRSSARSVISEISALLRVLRASPSLADGPASAPTVDLGSLDRLLAEFESSGLRVVRRVAGETSAVQGAVGVIAYRVIQEALANALKHGDGSGAELTLTIGEGLIVLEVSNPTGATRTASGSGQYGLIGMRERVASVRGTVTATQRDSMFTLHAELPYQPAMHSADAPDA